MKEGRQIFIDLKTPGCTVDKEIKEDIEQYLKHREKRIAAKKSN